MGFFFSSRRRHTRWNCDWSSDVCFPILVDLAGGSLVCAASGESPASGVVTNFLPGIDFVQVSTFVPSSPPTETYRVVLQDRKSTRLNSSHSSISYAVFCLKKKKNI